MPKFRKRPIVIEAETAKKLILATMSDWMSLPVWFRAAYERGDLIILPIGIIISTLEGKMEAGVNDWIICGVNGELYPCKADIFEKTYEPAE